MKVKTLTFQFTISDSWFFPSPTLYPSVVLSSFLYFFFFFSTACHSLGSSSNRMCLNTSGDDANRSSTRFPQLPNHPPPISLFLLVSLFYHKVSFDLVGFVGFGSLASLRETRGTSRPQRHRAHLCVNGRWNGDVGAEGAAAQRQNCPAAPLVSSGSVWSDWLSQTGW